MQTNSATPLHQDRINARAAEILKLADVLRDQGVSTELLISGLSGAKSAMGMRANGLLPMDRLDEDDSGYVELMAIDQARAALAKAGANN